MNKAIKSRADYEAALAETARLVQMDPKVGTPEADELELLSILVENFEKSIAPISHPTAIEAIQFRMDQQGLSARDLIPYIGSRSKVSEILSGKRQLTLPMVRALHEGLGIPAEALLKQELRTVMFEDLSQSELDSFPKREMANRGYFSNLSVGTLPEYPILQNFLEPAMAMGPLYRRGAKVRAGKAMDSRALTAWTARVIDLATRVITPKEFRSSDITEDSLKELVKLSSLPDGPPQSIAFLHAIGIIVIIEPHLPKTYLDGAAFMHEGRPIIGLTLRHDRLDNFWFSLLHEVAHIWKHVSPDSQFFDDLEVDSDDTREREADEIASEALIPSTAWIKSAASRLRSPEAALSLAKSLGISPAIVAGRMRKEFNAYKLLNSLVGHGQVRKWFRDVNWNF